MGAFFSVLSTIEQFPHLTARFWTHLVFAIFVLAFSLRLLALWSLSTTPYFTNLIIDESFYHALASRIANGTFIASSTYQFSLLPAYLMAAVYKLFSADVLYIRILNILLGSATCILICLLGQAMAGRLTGLLAGLVAALYKPFILYSIVPLKTALSLFLFAASMHLFMIATIKRSSLTLFALGLASGLMLTVRENTLAIVPLMLGMVVWSGYRDATSTAQLGKIFAILLAGVIVATGPFMARNYLVAGEFALTTHQAGFNLYLGNNPAHSDPYYRPAPFAVPFPHAQQIQFRIEASRKAGRTLSPGEASTYWVREVAQSAVSDTGAFTWKLWLKTLAIFNQFEAGDHYSIEFLSQFATFFKFPFFGFSVVLPLGLAGMVLGARESRSLLFLMILFLTYASTVIIFWPNARYRLPLLVVLIPFAILGLVRLRDHITQRRVKSLVLYSFLVLLMIVTEYFPLRATDDVSAYYNIHAMVLNRSGFQKEAMAYLESSSTMNKPFSAFANLALARKYLSQKEVQKAKVYLEKISDHSFAAALKYEFLGDTALLEGHTQNAITAYRRSLNINSGLLSPRRKLVKLLLKTNREMALPEYKILNYMASFYVKRE